MFLKTKLNDVSISSIILKTDNPHVNEIESKVNTQLKELCEEKNIYLIGNTKKIKLHHLSKGKLHFKVISDIFFKKISSVFSW